MALPSLFCCLFSATGIRAQAPFDRASSRLESTVDTSINPGDDFFGYANGAWLKAAVIPSGKDRWTVRDDISALTRRQVAPWLACA
jgi:predicted metalloendopeptidase